MSALELKAEVKNSGNPSDVHTLQEWDGVRTRPMVQNCKVTNSPGSRRKEKKLHANRLRMTNNHPEEKVPPIKAAVTAMNLQAPNLHIICFALKTDKNTNYSYIIIIWPDRKPWWGFHRELHKIWPSRFCCGICEDCNDSRQSPAYDILHFFLGPAGTPFKHGDSVNPFTQWPWPYGKVCTTLPELAVAATGVTLANTRLCLPGSLVLTQTSNASKLPQEN